MCGIVGYIGPRNAAEIILEGLRRLEYRGYDSAGIAVISDGEIEVRRDVGKLSNLARCLDESPIAGNIGVGHTRWATHGKPSERNAHPHADYSGQLVVVQNGIVENFRELRAELEAEGIPFQSETDTEVIAHLVGPALPGRLHARAGRAAGAGAAARTERDRGAVEARAGTLGDRAAGQRRRRGGRLWRGRDVHRLGHARHPRAHPAHGLPRKPPDGGRDAGRRDLLHARRRGARSPRSTTSPGTRSPRPRASTSTSCRRRSSSRRTRSPTRSAAASTWAGAKCTWSR